MDNYLIPKNGGCPVCSSMLIHIPPYYNCNECHSVFKFVEPMSNGGDEDVIVRLLNPRNVEKETGNGTIGGAI